MENWISVKKELPKYDKTPDSMGVQVLIWPPYNYEDNKHADSPTAFYGVRVSDTPNFYLYGAVIYPTHWMYLPSGPKEV